MDFAHALDYNINSNQDSTLDETVQEYAEDASDLSILPDGTFVFLDYDGVNYHIIAASIQDGLFRETVLPGEFEWPHYYFVQPDLKTAVIVVYKETLIFELVDLTTGKLTHLGGIISESPRQVVWQEEESLPGTESKGSHLAITDGNEVLVLNSDGTEIARHSSTGVNVVNMTTYNNELLVLYGGGQLVRYSWTDGTIISRINLPQHYSDWFSEDVSWEFDGDKLYLILQGYDQTMYIINLNTWEEEEMISYIIAYDNVRDRIISYNIDEEGVHLGYFHHYTTEDLRQKAQEALCGFQLTDEERSAYGLR